MKGWFSSSLRYITRGQQIKQMGGLKHLVGYPLFCNIQATWSLTSGSRINVFTRTYMMFLSAHVWKSLTVQWLSSGFPLSDRQKVAKKAGIQSSSNNSSVSHFLGRFKCTCTWYQWYPIMAWHRKLLRLTHSPFRRRLMQEPAHGSEL